MLVLSRLAVCGGAACLAGALAVAKVAAQPMTPARPAPTSLMARADALARQVAALRGLPLRAPIVKEVVDKRELRRRLMAMTDEPKEAEQLVRDEVLSKHWGLVAHEVDYHAMLIDVLSEQIAGYYDSDTKRLTLTDDPDADPDWSELVLSHEILHALQDQSFPLSKFRETPPGEDDAAMARLALIEGDGIGTMLETYNQARGLTIPWQSAAGLQQTADSLAEATESDSGSELDGTPLAVREALAFPYTAGFRFVAELRRQQPWSAVDAAFRRPPRSTEQILHPALYLRDERPLAVAPLTLPAALRQRLGPAATAGATTATSAGSAPPALAKAMSALRTRPTLETVWGELGFSLFLRSHGVDPRAAAIASAGWGGDRVTVLALDRQGGEVGVARMRWDSEADAREAYEAAVRAVDRWVVGVHLERSDSRTSWLDLDGRVSLVERRDASLVITHRAPLRAARALTDELWRSLPSPAPAASSAKKRSRRGRSAEE